MSGYDGGLAQSFYLELFESKQDKLLLNITRNEPIFKLTNLASDSSFLINVYAFNVKGRSNKNYSLSARTAGLPIELNGKVSFGITMSFIWIAE